MGFGLSWDTVEIETIEGRCEEMTTYLDKESVLKACGEAEKCNIFERIRRGDYDATASSERWRTCMAEKDAEIARLTVKISLLEGLCDIQKASLDEQEKLPKFLAPCPSPNDKCAHYAIYDRDGRGTRHCCMKWRDENDGKGIIHACEEPAQKAPEPELVICSFAKICKHVCFHKIPHPRECRFNQKC